MNNKILKNLENMTGSMTKSLPKFHMYEIYYELNKKFEEEILKILMKEDYKLYVGFVMMMMMMMIVMMIKYKSNNKNKKEIVYQDKEIQVDRENSLLEEKIVYLNGRLLEDKNEFKKIIQKFTRDLNEVQEKCETLMKEKRELNDIMVYHMEERDLMTNQNNDKTKKIVSLEKELCEKSEDIVSLEKELCEKSEEIDSLNEKLDKPFITYSCSNSKKTEHKDRNCRILKDKTIEKVYHNQDELDLISNNTKFCKHCDHCEPLDMR